MRNQMLTQLYADVTGRAVVEPAHEDAVLLGTGMAAAAAAGLYPDLAAAARFMQRSGLERLPEPAASGQFDRDYRIFLEMHRQRRMLDAMT
jgi:ribulose kinase